MPTVMSTSCNNATIAPTANASSKRNVTKIKMPRMPRPSAINEFCQLTAHERADAFRAFNSKAGAWERLHNLRFHLVAGVQRRSDGDVTPADLRGFLNGSVSKPDWLERTAYLADINLAGRAQRDEVTAAKIDTEVTLASLVKSECAGEQQRERAHARDKAFA